MSCNSKVSLGRGLSLAKIQKYILVSCCSVVHKCTVCLIDDFSSFLN